MPLRLHVLYKARKYPLLKGGAEPDGNGRASLGRALAQGQQAFACRILRLKYRANNAQHCLPLARKGEALAVPRKQRNTQHFFQAFHVSAQGRLGHEQPFCGAAHAGFFGNDRKIAQQPPIWGIKQVVCHA